MEMGITHLITLVFSMPSFVLMANAILTKEEFESTVTSNGYRAPDDEVYQYFEETTSDFTREEAAMFIAQLILESGGFKHTEQLGE